MIFDIQKASLTKRLTAFILDVILFAVFATGFAWIIGLVCDYDTHLDCSVANQEAYTTYYQRFYDVDFSKQYDKLSDADKAIWDAHTEPFNALVQNDSSINIEIDKLLEYRTKYLNSHGIDLFATQKEYDEFTAEQKEAWKSAYTACQEELRATYGENALLMKPISYVLKFESQHNTDLTANKSDLKKPELRAYNKAFTKCTRGLTKDVPYGQRMMMVISFTILITSLSILLSMALLEFGVPLIFKNGQTIGKKVFGIAVMHENGVKVNAITMFVRTFLGKYAVETMSPALLILLLFMGNGAISIIVFALIILFEIVLFIWKKNTRPFIHDVFAKTVCVDLASQMIFENEEEMLAFRRATYAEKSSDGANNVLYSTSTALADSFVEVKKEDK
ncbi:MAG: RDD family protein [Clostridia bacterium]|nr:RDD family protein [Clostridia bacterium]